MENKNWAIRLDNAGTNKLAVISTIRASTGLGLKDAKDLVDTAPQFVVSNLSEQSAREWESKFREVGAVVTVVSNYDSQSSTNTNWNYRSPDEIRDQEQRIAQKSAEIDKKQPSGCLIAFLAFIGLCWFMGSTGIEIGAWGIIIIIAIICIVVAIMQGSSKGEQLNTLKEEIKAEQAQKRNEMGQVLGDAKSKGFTVSMIVTDPKNRYCIAADEIAKKFLVKNKTGSTYKVFDYSSLIDFEISQDGVSSLASRAGSALVGGVLFGSTGAVVGASRKKDIKEYCSSLYIALTTNDVSDFRLVVPFIEEKIEKESEEYKFSVNRAKEMVSLLQFIQRSADEKHVEVTAPVLEKGSNSTELEAVEAVKKYKELLDLGIISPDEFEKRKRNFSIYNIDYCCILAAI